MFVGGYIGFQSLRLTRMIREGQLFQLYIFPSPGTTD